ncbi:MULTISPECIES: hypothetical protein [Auritidibacter]|uniref:Uncharacterized protein n=1 Tax=Auritidibacter ignavus TaxID=678932 RepID=A0AAJ6AFP9_9MICC|nr:MULTISPECIES: hypothetical protein [Auritidibacter]PXA76784.1 hypothetical protein DCC26_08970 [Auritidibacter sp. NML120779]AXR74441.1 hypothetical protein DCC27_009230 [Auritidibacter sp. NML130574]NIH72701.1 hypothetical protein [Auritidibacter ignavus]RMX22320.1 hypothetical protein DYI20_10595 [Auritidibacter ignavus]WGH80958.1 hypothetical protein QDX25_09175 [Auritidibacter ignavus]
MATRTIIKIKDKLREFDGYKAIDRHIKQKGKDASVFHGRSRVRGLRAGLARGGLVGRPLRVTYIGEDNPASAEVFRRAGGYRLHGIGFLTTSVQAVAQPDSSGWADRVRSRNPDSVGV